jgi:hypothetical protein
MVMLGVIWATFAPLLLVVAMWALRALLRRVGAPAAGLLATVATLGVVGGLYFWDRAGFERTCAEIGMPTIRERAVAEGVLLTSPTAASFGARYLYDEGFAWIERADPTTPGGFVRVTRDAAGAVNETKIAAPTARYEVQETHDGAGTTRVRIVDRDTGVEMAQAGDALFDGGRAKWALGAYGVASCLSAFHDPEQFKAFYHFARRTLRPAAADEPSR